MQHTLTSILISWLTTNLIFFAALFTSGFIRYCKTRCAAKRLAQVSIVDASLDELDQLHEELDELDTSDGDRKVSIHDLTRAQLKPIWDVNLDLLSERGYRWQWREGKKVLRLSITQVRQALEEVGITHAYI